MLNSEVIATIFFDLKFSQGSCSEVSIICSLNFPNPKSEDDEFAQVAVLHIYHTTLYLINK